MLYTLDLADERHQLTEWQSVRFQIRINFFCFSLYVHSTQILVGNSRWCSFAREEIEKCGKKREKVREIEGKPRTIGEKARDSIFSILINECIQFGLLFLQTATRWIFWEFQLNQMSCSLCSCWMFWLPNLSKEKKNNKRTHTHSRTDPNVHPQIITQHKW